MTREEQIKKAAHDFSWGWCDDEAHPLNDGFIEGAKWADSHPHWIPVEEKLPTRAEIGNTMDEEERKRRQEWRQWRKNKRKTWYL